MSAGAILVGTKNLIGKNKTLLTLRTKGGLS
jgi:hypothetical protein